MTTVTAISLAAVIVGSWCIAMQIGYWLGVRDTERRWSDAVARKADHDASR